MEAVFRDIRYASRMLLKDRRFSVTAILTLAMCLGVNVVVFTVVNAVLLQPLSLPDGERIVLMANQYPGQDAADNPGGRGVFSYAPDYFDRLRQTTVFEAQAMFTMAGITIEMDDRPQRVQAMVATPSLFRVMSVPPIRGRAFEDAEGEVGSAQRVILGYEAWQRWFNRDPASIGRDLRVNGRPYRIVGVMPQDFVFINPRSGDRVDVWLPLAFSDAQKTSRFESAAAGRWMHVARLKPGATIEQAREQVRAIDAANLASLPEWRSFLTTSRFYTSVEPAQEFLIREVRPTLHLLWGGALVLLLISGVNIANIVLARSMTRVKEIATRLALGAGRVRVARQIVIENVVLALVSGAVGLLAASWLLDSLTSIGLNQLPRAAEIGLDASVIVWTLATCVTGGALIGVVPMGVSSMPRLADVLRSEGRSTTFGVAGRLARRGLIVVQVGLAFALLLGSGLLLATFRQLLGVDPGFSPERVVTASVTLPSTTYPDDPAIVRVLTRALDGVRGIPGVTAAGVTDSIPLDGSSRFVVVAPADATASDPPLAPCLVVVTPGYFEAMRIGLVRGRYLDERDREGRARVAVVDQRLARRYWPDRDPIGQTFYMPFTADEMTHRTNPDHWLTVVGVVRNVHQFDVSGQIDGIQVGTFYTAYAQPYDPALPHRRTVKIAIRSQIAAEEVLRRVRDEMASIDPTQPLWDVRTMEERIDLALMTRRASTIITLGFGGMALCLAALGIYGVLTHLVAQRTREVGIRIALGGTARHIVNLILREGLVLIACGLIAGLVVAIAGRALIESQLYGVQTFEPGVVAAVVATLIVVGVVACLVPARRATRVDPIEALRGD